MFYFFTPLMYRIFPLLQVWVIRFTSSSPPPQGYHTRVPHTMLVAASLATAFTLPARLPPLASSARYAAVHMLDNDGNKSDRYNFEDPRQILNNFFNPSGKVPKVFKTGGKSGKDTSEASGSSDGAIQEMIQDSCIDWGALSPREVAAAFMMLKGGSLC